MLSLPLSPQDPNPLSRRHTHTSDSLIGAPGSLVVLPVQEVPVNTIEPQTLQESSSREETPQILHPSGAGSRFAWTCQYHPNLWGLPLDQVLSSGSYPRSWPHTGKQAEKLRIKPQADSYSPFCLTRAPHETESEAGQKMRILCSHGSN